MLPVFAVVMMIAGLLIFDVLKKYADLICKCPGVLEDFMFYGYDGLINKEYIL
jgi:hypothetical protein